MMSNVFGSLLTQVDSEQVGGKRASAPRGSKKNGTGRPFMSYEKLTVEQLQKKAKKNKIAYSGLKKAELIAALRKK